MKKEIIQSLMWNLKFTKSDIRCTMLAMVLVLLLPCQLISEKKQIFSVVIHYLDGVTFTSVEQDCTTFFEFPSAQDTIVLDRSIYPKLETIIVGLANDSITIADNAIFCDIRLTAIVLYTNQTYDLICIAGDHYKKACVKYNGNIVGSNPELVWFFYTVVYDISKPLHRRILFGITD